MSTLVTLNEEEPGKVRKFVALHLSADVSTPDEAFDVIAPAVRDFLLHGDKGTALDSLDRERMSLTPADLLDGAVPEEELRVRGIFRLKPGEGFSAQHLVVLPFGDPLDEGGEPGGGEIVDHETIMRLDPEYYER